MSSFKESAVSNTAQGRPLHQANSQSYPLNVTRNKGWYGAARALVIYAQTPMGNVKLGKVKHGKTVQVEVPQNATQLYGKMDWAKSEKLDLAFINPGDTVYANLRFSLNPLRIFGIPNMPCRMETQPK